MALARYSPENIRSIAHVGHRLSVVLDRIAACVRSSPGDAWGVLAMELADAGLEQIVPAEFGPQAESGRRFGIAAGGVAAHGACDPAQLAPGMVATIDLLVRDPSTGWHADAARPVVVGGQQGSGVDSARADKLVRAAEAVTRAGIGALRPGGRWRDAVLAVRAAAGAEDVRLVQGLGGHGIGQHPHERPGARFGPFDPRRDDFELATGLVFTVEPVVTDGGGAEPTLGPDGVSLMMPDGGWCACREETVAVLPEGCRVLTGLVRGAGLAGDLGPGGA